MAAAGSVREYPLVVGVDRDGDSLSIHAVGELDLATASLLEVSLSETFEQRDTSAITVDLTGVRFIDLAGMEVLMEAAARSRENGDRLRIRCGSGAVRRMIEMTGVERSLPLVV